MKLPSYLLPLLTAAVLTVGTSDAQAQRRAYGVSGDRGTAVRTPRGVAWSGENSSGAVTRRGAAVATDNGVAAVGRRGAVVAGDNGVAVARRPLPRGYIHTVPVGYRRVMYGGYNCYFVGGVYYRAVMYEGATVYVIVT